MTTNVETPKRRNAEMGRMDDDARSHLHAETIAEQSNFGVWAFQRFGVSIGGSE